MSVLEQPSTANSGWSVEWPLETYGRVAANNVKESIVATGVSYK